MTPAEELLTDIRDGIQELVAIAKARQARPAAPSPVSNKPVVAWPADRTIAPDSDLDGKYGDPVINAAPRDWTGPFTPGQKMSESMPVLLDLVADRSEYFATKNDRERATTDKGVPKSKYDRQTAARARGWAIRIRKGYKPPQTPLMDEAEPWKGDDFT